MKMFQHKRAVSDEKLWWTYIANKHYMLSFEKWLWWKEKKNIDGRESFHAFKCPVDSIFEEIKERFLEHIQIYNCYFKSIFDIGPIIVNC